MTAPASIEGFRLEDWPPQWTQEPYEIARRELLSRFRDHPGVEAIVEFGTTTFPGISDMDVYVLLSEDCRDLKFPGYWVFDGLARQTMTHDFFLMRAEYYRHSVHYFDPWIRTHSLLHGNSSHNLPGRPVEGEENVWLRLDHVHDCLFQIPYVVGCLRRKTLPVRHLMDVICYAGYCLREVNAAARFFGLPETASDFSTRLDALRRSFSESGGEEDKARLSMELTRESLRLFARSYLQFASIVESRLVDERAPASTLASWLQRHGAEALLLTTQAAILYRDRGLDETALAESWLREPVTLKAGWGPLGRRLEVSVVEVPAALAGFFAAHLDARGEFADLSASCFHAAGRRRRLPCRALSRRLQLWNDNWVWLRSVRHPESGGKSPHLDFGFPLDMGWKRRFLARGLMGAWHGVRL